MADKLKSKLGWITLISVLLNIFLLGFIIGEAVQAEGRQRHHKLEQEDITEKLSPEHAKQFKRMMHDLRREDKALRAEMEQVRKEIFDALAGPNFDQSVYVQKVQELHNLHGQRIDNRTSAIVGLAPSLNQEEREVVAKQMRRKKHRKRHHDGPPPQHDRPPPRRENP